jgi:hypothetical protein
MTELYKLMKGHVATYESGIRTYYQRNIDVRLHIIGITAYRKEPNPWTLHTSGPPEPR